MGIRRVGAASAVLVMCLAAQAPVLAHDTLSDLQNEQPVAAISFSGDGQVGQPISFDGSGSTDADGAIRDYVWDFNDGSTAIGRIVTHAWSRPGTFMVSLLVHDNLGCASGHTVQLVRVHGSTGEPPYAIRQPEDVKIPLRDHTLLSARLFLPNASGRFPVLMTHANDPAEGIELGPFTRSMVESGFAFLHVTARGQGTSQGLVNYSKQVGLDGYDITEWAAAQSWSDGHHAFLFGSNYGYRGWMAVQANPPHLTTAALANTPEDVYRDLVWTGGVFSVNGIAIIATLAHGLAAVQAAQARDPATASNRAPNAVQVTAEMASHDVLDDFWRDYVFDLQNVTIPVLYHVGWTDVFYPRQGFEFYRRAMKRTGGKLVVWPGGHGPNYPDPIEPTGLFNQETLDRLWLEDKMAGIEHAVETWSPVTTYRMEGGWLSAYRSGLGAWIERSDWPVPGTQWTRYYLSGGDPGRGGALTTDAPAAGEVPDTLAPAPAGVMDARFANFYGNLWSSQVATRTGEDPWPQYDSAQDQALDDAASLSFQTEAFDTDVEVTGPLTLTAYVASSAVDTDLVAQLSDVWPDGHARFLANGTLRASMRALDESTTLRSGDDIVQPHFTFTQHDYLTPGTIYELNIEIYPTSNLFKVGHRLRLDLAQVDVPMSVSAGAPAVLFHDADHPSRLIVPIQPAEGQ